MASRHASRRQSQTTKYTERSQVSAPDVPHRRKSKRAQRRVDNSPQVGFGASGPINAEVNSSPHASPSVSALHIAVLCAVYNRREITVANLGKLHAALRELQVDAEFFILDDASTDGTAVALEGQIDRVNIVRGTGSLYWAGGMRAAYIASRSQAAFRPTHYLLVNDDVRIEERGLENIVSLAQRGKDVLVGRTIGASGGITYGGYAKTSGFSPLALSDTGHIWANHLVDTFNCNFVLIRAPLYESLGGIDGRFGHAYGDLDLGLRLARQCVPLVAVGRPIGVCERNAPRLISGSFSSRLRTGFLGPLGIGPYVRFVGRHGPRWRVPILVARWATRRFLESAAPRRQSSP